MPKAEREPTDVDRVRVQTVALDLVLHELIKMIIDADLLPSHALTLLQQRAQGHLQGFQQGGDLVHDVEGSRLATALDRFFQHFAGPTQGTTHA